MLWARLKKFCVKKKCLDIDLIRLIYIFLFNYMKIKINNYNKLIKLNKKNHYDMHKNHTCQ
jgi:hypothetical protein